MRSPPGTSSICEEFVQIGWISTWMSTTLTPNPLPTTTTSAEPCISTKVVSILEGVFNLETDVIWLFRGKDGELCTNTMKCNFATASSTSFGNVTQIWTSAFQPARSQRDQRRRRSGPLEARCCGSSTSEDVEATCEMKRECPSRARLSMGCRLKNLDAHL